MLAIPRCENIPPQFSFWGWAMYYLMGNFIFFSKIGIKTIFENEKIRWDFSEKCNIFREIFVYCSGYELLYTWAIKFVAGRSPKARKPSNILSNNNIAKLQNLRSFRNLLKINQNFLSGGLLSRLLRVLPKFSTALINFFLKFHGSLPGSLENIMHPLQPRETFLII